MTTPRESEADSSVNGLKRFVQKPWHEKIETIRVRWYMLRHAKILGRFPVRLPFGSWWVPRKDHVSEPLIAGTFETAELAFVERFLHAGMTVLDIGAHHGLYTLLASRRVGRKGKVVAFEPSPRERKALQQHLRINLCSNVSVQTHAVGEKDAEANLYVVEEWAAGCNSLKPPDVPAAVAPTGVHIVRLDDWLAKSKIDQVDFIKLDVEGAELAVLKGAQELLTRRPRPVMLVEVQDLRTLPWGYAAHEIVNMLEQLEYGCFQLSETGKLLEIDTGRKEFDLNLIAIPNEKNESILSRMNEVSRT